MKYLYYILCLLLFAACGKIDSKKAEQQPISVRTIEVGLSQSAGQRTYVGTIKAGREVTLSSKYPASVEAVNVKQGSAVAEGDEVVILSSQTVQSAYDMARATLNQAEDAYSRLQKVNATNSVPEIQMVEIESKLQQARAQYDAAAKSLADCRLKSPLSGVVAVVDAEKGFDVQPLQPLVKIFDISSLEVDFAVPETEIGNYTIGDTATVVIPALKNSEAKAVLTIKGIEASTVSHTYTCVLRVVNTPKGLMPGMVSKVLIAYADAEDIVIPSATVKLDNQGRYVWVVDNGVAKRRYITLGEFSGKGVIVESGLNCGDVVITDGSQKVCVGSKVNIVE